MNLQGVASKAHVVVLSSTIYLSPSKSMQHYQQQAEQNRASSRINVLLLLQIPIRLTN